ncbi:MAG: NAD-dependent epimerase/dehydratase family protein [Pseudonocardia sp.]
MTGRMVVTGCEGFIGRSVGLTALGRGWEVLGIGRGSGHRWPACYRRRDVAVDDLTPVLAGFAPDVVVHAAGAASVEASFRHPADDFRGSVLTWANLLEGVRSSATDPLVIGLSSAAVYGQPVRLPVAEDAPRRPMSPYGHHRRACEVLMTGYARCFGVQGLVARVFSVIGPGQRRLLAHDLATQALGPEPTIEVRGTGNESRDFLHVDDVASALVGLASARSSMTRPEFVNVAGGRETTVRELAETVRDLAAPHKPVRYLGEQMRGSPARWVADVTRLRTALPSWQPRSPSEAIAACLDVWRADPQETR